MGIPTSKGEVELILLATKFFQRRTPRRFILTHAHTSVFPGNFRGVLFVNTSILMIMLL